MLDHLPFGACSGHRCVCTGAWIKDDTLPAPMEASPVESLGKTTNGKKTDIMEGLDQLTAALVHLTERFSKDWVTGRRLVQCSR